MLNREISKKLNSAEYQVLLSETLTSIITSLKSATSEATVSSIFENELYFFLKSYFSHEVIFHKESGESYLRHKFTGRMDAISNGLIIEYKALDKLDKKDDKNKAINQVKDYLTQIYNETGNSLQALLTNGRKLCYFYFVGEDIKYTPFKSVDVKDIDRIVRTLLEVGTKQFDPVNIVNDFKLNSSSEITINLAKSLYETIKMNKTYKTNMLFEEWQVLFRLSESDKGQNQDIIKRRNSLSRIFDDEINNNEKEYMALYVLQTTYAIIVKLMACKVISNLTFNEEIMFFSDLSMVHSTQLQKFMEKLEDGYVFSSGGIKNLLEGDFYSWYSDKNQWNKDIYTSIKNIVIELENYASSKFTYEYSTIDIFKDLYIEIMPNEVRHSLGEYFTPAWLADNVVNRAIGMLPEEKLNTWRAIDPCCGSGIFIISLIKKIQNGYELYSLTIEEKNSLLEDILNRVQGIDLNPLSVLTARVSYFLSILPLLNDQKFEIPIYLGDSADIPQKVNIGGIDCYNYKIETKQGSFAVDLPCVFVESKSFFEQMYRLQTTIKAEDSELLFQQLINYIGQTNVNEEITRLIKKLCNNLVKLHENEWDGIWIRIASNFMLIARVKDIDLIVGNPPWVKWEFLPQNYALKIKSLCIDRKLFSGQTYMGAIALNLCALIANVTADAWLTDEGILAFLMPKTIMTQDSYAGFRKFYLKDNSRLYLQEIDDWSKAGNPFIVTTEKFLTYFYSRKDVNYSKGIPINYYNKKNKIKITEINRYHSFQKISNFFDIKDGMAYQLDETRTGFTMVPDRDFEILEKFQIIIGECQYKARSGVEFTPAEVYFVEPMGDTSQEGTYYFKTSEFNNSFYKSNYEYKFELETTYIKPVIKGPNIKPFEIIESNNYCIFPYDDGDKNAVRLEELIKENELLANYLIDNKDLIGSQSARSLMISMGDDFYSLSKVGLYTFATNKVAFRDNTAMNASVVNPIITPWGKEELPVCAKHCPYISMDKNGEFITNDEAHYICGILNTEIVEKYFKYTFSGRSYSINFNIKIPKYDIRNRLHKEISELAKKAVFSHDKKSYQTKIENIYLEICKIG